MDDWLHLYFSASSDPRYFHSDTLRRRVAREEKQQLMTDKVKDIKRKQREMEEGVVASKKRRSLLVKITLAAVLIGFVCICYSRK